MQASVPAAAGWGGIAFPALLCPGAAGTCILFKQTNGCRGTPDCRACCCNASPACSEVRGVAVPLVDAFAIPDHILRAPIGLSTTTVDPCEWAAACWQLAGSLKGGARRCMLQPCRWELPGC